MTGRIIAAGFAVLLAFSMPARLQERGGTIEARFPAPAGYARGAVPPDSFAVYLRRLPLKPDGAKVRFFDGKVKPASGIYAAVVDLPIGDRDLHQCADAIIRLRAEYLLSAGRPDGICFRFTGGFPAEYARWRRGERIVVRAGAAVWTRTTPAIEDDRDFWSYLEMVFAYAGTASLAAELESVSAGDDLEIGDVFIQPGYPGHAVIIVDLAVDHQSGRKVFLLAQSFMPAQEIQVLVNPGDSGLSPWYAADFGTILRTPEWTFASRDLKRFRDE